METFHEIKQNLQKQRNEEFQKFNVIIESNTVINKEDINKVSYDIRKFTSKLQKQQYLSSFHVSPYSFLRMHEQREIILPLRRLWLAASERSPRLLVPWWMCGYCFPPSTSCDFCNLFIYLFISIFN